MTTDVQTAVGSLSRESSTVGNFPATERLCCLARRAGRARRVATGELTSAHESCFSTLAAGTTKSCGDKVR